MGARAEFPPAERPERTLGPLNARRVEPGPDSYAPGERIRVVRIYHSAVVRGFRARDHHLRALGVDETLITPMRWNEGGKDVAFDHDQGEREWVRPASTVGRHPYRFVYDPVPIARAMRSMNPHVLDVHEEPASLAVAEALLLRLVLRRHAAVTLYSAQNIYKRYPPPFRWIERWALRCAHTIYCCNSEAADVLRRKGFRGRTPVIGLGVDVERFTPQHQRQVEAGFTLGYVGRLEHHKGVQVLIESLRLLPEQVVLHIVGAGPYRSELETMAAPMSGRIRFMDFVPHEDVPALYRSFDALVIPSIPTPSWKEQFGRVAVEAMASGVPVVASADGSLPEVVGPGGVLVPPNDSEALTMAIAALVDDESLRSEYATAGRKWAQQYSWAAVAEQHLEIYQEAVR